MPITSFLFNIKGALYLQYVSFGVFSPHKNSCNWCLLLSIQSVSETAVVWNLYLCLCNKHGHGHRHDTTQQCTIHDDTRILEKLGHDTVAIQQLVYTNIIVVIFVLELFNPLYTPCVLGCSFFYINKLLSYDIDLLHLCHLC